MEYFTANTPSSQLCIMLNDWPYSIPPSAQHFLVWSKLPILHPALVDERIAMRLDQDGLCGFTGTDAPDPTTADLQRALPALGAWGITMDSLVTSPDPTEDEARMMERAAEEVRFFVMRRWREEEWETTWFVNPPVGICITKIIRERLMAMVEDAERAGLGTFPCVCP